MDITALLLQFGGSLVAILALFFVARALKLGGKPKLGDDAQVQACAREVLDGFDVQRIAIARSGDAALAQDDAGRIMVLKRHGNRFAGRILSPAAKVREEVDALIVDTGEVRFGEIRLSIKDPAYWADAINRL